MAALVAGEQPCRREHDVLRVLQVVVDGVDAEVAGHLAGEELVRSRAAPLPSVSRGAPGQVSA
jgi:hypothetical protein